MSAVHDPPIHRLSLELRPDLMSLETREEFIVCSRSVSRLIRLCVTTDSTNDVDVISGPYRYTEIVILDRYTEDDLEFSKVVDDRHQPRIHLHPV